MYRVITVGLAMGLLLCATGCANNAIRADGAARSGAFFGDFGIWGDNNSVTVQRLSRLHKLSFIGDDNEVTVRPGATINHIEFWGRRNVVRVPETLMVRMTEFGEDNKVVRVPERSQADVTEKALYQTEQPWNEEIEGGDDDWTEPLDDDYPYQPEPVEPEDIRSDTQE